MRQIHPLTFNVTAIVPGALMHTGWASANPGEMLTRTKSMRNIKGMGGCQNSLSSGQKEQETT